jgi:hypothetical protein
LQTPRAFNGIIATIDCDHAVSANYIYEIINSYENNPRLNGLSGNWEFDFNCLHIPHSKYFEKAFLHFLNSYGIAHIQTSSNTKFQANKNALKFSSNMTVTVKAWILAGGMPKIIGQEDVRFGEKVGALSGDVGVNPAYSLIMRVRFSDRCGARGDGRVVSLLANSVADFFSGKSDRIVFFDSRLMKDFHKEAHNAWRQGQIDAAFMEKIAKKYKFDVSGFSPYDFEEYAQGLSQVFQQYVEKYRGAVGSPRYAWLVDNKVVRAYPLKDITQSVVGPEVYKFYQWLWRWPRLRKLYSIMYHICYKTNLIV